MLQIISKLSNGQSVPLDNLFRFIEYVWRIDNPDKEYDVNITKKVFNIGFGQELINGQYDKVYRNPKKYGFKIDTLSNKNGNFIKNYVYEDSGN